MDALTLARRRHLRRTGKGVGRSTRSRWMLALMLFAVAVLVVNVAFFRRVSQATSSLSSPTSSLRDRRVEPAAESVEQQTRIALSLARVASDSPSPRGIVLPLFDDIATLGVSLILELRDMGVELPVEVPHCGDLDAALYEQLVQHDRLVRVYDVCVLALSKVDMATGEPLFCVDLADCHTRFRGFNIKVLALVLSRFQEVMLLDADTLFFQNPMELWTTPKYKATGTLFFHDRISYERHYLAKRVQDGQDQYAVIHDFLTTFDASPYRTLDKIPRAASILTRLSPLQFSFQPSEFLLKSHSWTLRAGHQMDSSLVLWNKPRQPRATAILASFVALNGLPTPPSYGDKEFYFIACELAETAYEFSDYGVGAIGLDVLSDQGDGSSVLCGDALHYFPEPATQGLEPRPLYMNSDNILAWAAETERAMYRTKARPAWYYPGSFTTKGLDQTCPFNVSLVPLMEVESELLSRRQKLHKTAQNWAEGSGYVFKASGVLGLWRAWLG